jgi:suppressor of ftsI/bilirubin oxidase
MKEISRRDFLTTIAGTSGYLILKSNPAFSFPGFFDNRNTLALPSDNGLFGVLDPSDPFTMYARETRHQILPFRDTQLWTYEVEAGGKQYINPIIKIKKGETLSTLLENELPEATIIHWHGLHVDYQNDGHPVYQIQPLDEYPYEFPVLNRAATYWYHTHAHRRTAFQAYYGLASLFIVEDEDERQLTESLDLNFGETDIPLIIQDKTFDSSGDLIYTQNPMGAMDGFLGDTILANLTYRPYLNVSSRIYRFRILNASNARIYRLAFSNSRTSMPFYLIGTDGGLLTTPQQVTEAFLSPGERIDVLLDLSRSRAGETVWLKSLAFSGANDCRMMGGGGMMGGGIGQCSSLPNGTPFPILRLNVTRKTPYDKVIPAELSSISPIETSDAETRRFTLSFAMMRWLINGLSFDMDYVPVTVARGSTEIWEISNPLTSMGMGMTGMMNMPHPMHIHGFQFQVLQRINSPYQVRRLALDGTGVLPTDMGLKDTVLVWPGEKVRIAINFSHNFPGSQLYLLHCHILEHEDNGMMMNYEVV